MMAPPPPCIVSRLLALRGVICVGVYLIAGTAGNYPEPPVWSGSSCHLVCCIPLPHITPDYFFLSPLKCNTSQVNASFISQSSRVLAPGGTFQMLTDDAAYAAAAVRELAVGARASLAPAKGRHFSTSHSHGDDSGQWRLLMLNVV